MAECRIAWVNENRAYFYFYNLENPANLYDEFGLAASTVSDIGQNVEPYGVVARYYTDNTNNRFGLGIDLTSTAILNDLEAARQPDNSYILYAYAKYEGRYYQVNSYLHFHIRTPEATIYGVSDLGFTMRFENLGCAIGPLKLGDTEYMNESWVGVVLEGGNYSSAHVSETHNITDGEYIGGTTSTFSYSGIVEVYRRLENNVQYTAYPARGFEVTTSDGDTKFVVYVIGGIDGKTFSLQEAVDYFHWSPPAETALHHHGVTTDVPYTDWNSLVDTVWKLLEVRNLLDTVADEIYVFEGNTLQDLLAMAYMYENDKVLTAGRFNYVRYCIDNAGPRIWSDSYTTFENMQSGDPVLGDDVDALRVNLSTCVEYYIEYGE